MRRRREGRPSGKTLILAALMCALSGMGGACNGHVRPPDDLVTDPSIMMDHLIHRLEGLESARVRVVAEYYGGDMRGANFRQVLLVRQPNNVHIQTLSPFGQTLQMLVANAETLSLYDLEAETYYYGSPSPENLARLLPFYMTAADIVSVLLGGPPLDQIHTDRTRYSLEWDGGEGRYRMVVPLVSLDGTLELGIRHGDWTIASAKRTNAMGDLVFELRTGDFEAVEGTAMPQRLRFLLEGDTPVDMSIEAESIELNVELPDSLFVLEAPRGVDQQSLD